jgi:hypothetical protein
MRLQPCLLAVLFAFAVRDPQAPAPQGPAVAKLDLTGKSLPAGWRLAAAAHEMANGELVVTGGGSLDRQEALGDRNNVTVSVLTDEKANVEVHLVDGKGKVRYAFAFLGQFHPVLERVALAMLKDDHFVQVNPRLWLFPGRAFQLEVRRARNQFQMFLNGELGPVFSDPDAVAGDDLHLRVVWVTEGAKDKVHLRGVTVARQ